SSDLRLRTERLRACSLCPAGSKGPSCITLRHTRRPRAFVSFDASSQRLLRGPAALSSEGLRTATRYKGRKSRDKPLSRADRYRCCLVRSISLRLRLRCRGKDRETP